jgi:hypothetical protein
MDKFLPLTFSAVSLSILREVKNQVIYGDHPVFKIIVKLAISEAQTYYYWSHIE